MKRTHDSPRNKNGLKKEFPKLKGKILFNEPLWRHTTFRIGGRCKIWAEPGNENELKEILKFARAKRRTIFIIGMGSNILFKERLFDGVFINLAGKGFKRIKVKGTKLTAGAGVALNRMVRLACKKSLEGIEGLAGIPGTLGGAVFMNSGYRGNISSFLEKVKVMHKISGDTQILKRKNINFAYRHSDLNKYIILEASFNLKKGKRSAILAKQRKLLRHKRETQPLGSMSAGCIFKNPVRGDSAARYVEALGLKGKRIGDAKISEKHANFIINLKKARSGDVLRLINLVKKRVKSRFNIDLVPEVKIL